jgi:beta-galactosidase
MPTAGNEITFTLTGPGKIIGVGNGDPSSHQPDKFVEKISTLDFASWRRSAVDSIENRPEVAFDFDDANWQSAAGGRGRGNRGGAAAPAGQTNVYRGTFELAQPANGVTVTFVAPNLGDRQWVFLNGQPVAQNVPRTEAARGFKLDSALLRSGKNVIAVIATPSTGGGRRGQGGGGGGAPSLKVVTSPGDWKRSLFNGLAQVIVQSTQHTGEITLTATAQGVTPGILKLQVQPTPLRPAVAAQ